MSRMSTMEKVVKKDIEDNIKNVENVVKTVALIAQQKGADSGAIMQICDSIVVRTPDIERAYVAFSDSDNYGNKELNECIRIAKSKKISLWSSPHYVTKRSNQSPVTTFLTPLINEKGEVKGVLCAVRKILELADDFKPRKVCEIESGIEHKTFLRLVRVWNIQFDNGATRRFIDCMKVYNVYKSLDSDLGLTRAYFQGTHLPFRAKTCISLAEGYLKLFKEDRQGFMNKFVYPPNITSRIDKIR